MEQDQDGLAGPLNRELRAAMRRTSYSRMAERKEALMEVLDLIGSREFSPTHHIQKFLAESPRLSISIACWEPGQTSPIHSHPRADEVYHVLQGEGLFSDGRDELHVGVGGTVLFPAGEAHRVKSLTRMVLFRVQAGADRFHTPFAEWPHKGVVKE